MPDQLSEDPDLTLPEESGAGDSGRAEWERVRRYRALLAPGTPLRAGLDRIVRGRTGAMVVLGSTPEVTALSTGGFRLDEMFTPTGLRELAKMDGAIVITADFEHIVAAGVHLVPDGALPTLETGTRHRTADRVSRQTGVPVVTVSSSMATISLFLDGQRYVVESSDQILSRSQQALAALARYRDRLAAQARRLSDFEVRDAVTYRDLERALLSLEMVRRLERELRAQVAALGIDGRLLQVQLIELVQGVDDLADQLQRDYAPDGSQGYWLSALSRLSDAELTDSHEVAAALGIDVPEGGETRLSPRGHRQLSKVADIPPQLADRLLRHFGSLQELFAARTADLVEVEGVDQPRARALREGLAHLADNATDELE